MFTIDCLKKCLNLKLFLFFACISCSVSSSVLPASDELKTSINQFLDELPDDKKLKAKKEIESIKKMISNVDSIVVSEEWDGQTIASYIYNSNTLKVSEKMEHLSENLALVFLYHETIHFKRKERYMTNKVFLGQQANYFGLVSILAEEYSEELIAYYLGADLASKLVEEHQFTCTLNEKTFSVSKLEYAFHQTLSVLSARIKELEENKGDWNLNLMYRSVVQLISDALPHFRKVIKNTDIEKFPYSSSLACGLNV